jgi:hypothetical protein
MSSCDFLEVDELQVKWQLDLPSRRNILTKQVESFARHGDGPGGYYYWMFVCVSRDNDEFSVGKKGLED